MKEQFDFGLERVRKVRAHAEDRAKEALAASIAHRLRGEATLQSVSEQIRTAQDSHREGLFDGDAGQTAVIDPSALVRRQAYLERLERTRIVAALEVDRAEAEVDARRQVLTGASRKREVLDRLRDRQAATHALAWNRHQGAQLDEIALQAHIRGRAAA
ncbi:flagellar export protein FliJ [Paraconexibacter sp.]|uniref:flagellar export protein FliJ n=1 Tax=Paraconexibacter sp. TaxID=2949640 RepID=UPI0035686C0A